MTNLQFFKQQVGDEGTGHTIGQFIEAVLRIKDAKNARRFYLGAVKWGQEAEARGLKAPVGMTPEEVIKLDIGWCFGEGMSPEMVQMWVEVCGARHPMFGQTLPSPIDAIEMGREVGEKILHSKQ